MSKLFPSKLGRRTPCDRLSDSPLFDLQRSSYVFTEFVSAILLGITLLISPQSSYHPIISTILLVISFHLVWALILVCVIPKPRRVPTPGWYQPTHPIPKFKQKRTPPLSSEDRRLSINYYVSIPNQSLSQQSNDTIEKGDTMNDDTAEKVSGTKERRKIMLLACPLGVCGPEIYYPLIAHLGDEYTYISWDYRGFWNSTSSKHNYPSLDRTVSQQSPSNSQFDLKGDSNRIRRISIHDFANDAAAIMDAEGIETVDVMVGFSMGVPVTLEFVVLFPHRVSSIVLLNGAHGTVFNTAFQPLLRIPFLGDLVEEFVAYIARHPHALKYSRKLLITPATRIALNIYVRIFGSPLLKKLPPPFGPNYLFEFFQSYLVRLSEDDESLRNYIRVFQEMHAHSVYHLLEQIEHPCLIVSGFWDLLTPALHSFEMARRLKRVRHVCDVFSGHAVILENPESCVYEVVTFLEAVHHKLN